MKLYEFQEDCLKKTESFNSCAYYLDMGLGKTFVGAEKIVRLGNTINLLICQKSKIQDWIDHFFINYNNSQMLDAYDLTDPKEERRFYDEAERSGEPIIGVINYELAFRRKGLLSLRNIGLLLDESSEIQNEQTKRFRFIKKLDYKSVVLLSGTPTGGRYERLWSQLHLLGWKISKELFWSQFIAYHYEDREGFPLLIIDGYKNVDRLKAKMAAYGCIFLKTEDVFELPEQVFIDIKVARSKEYSIFRKDRLIEIDAQGEKKALVGDSVLKEILYLRMLAGAFNMAKYEALEDIFNSTDGRIIIFYNFKLEYDAIKSYSDKVGRPFAYVNGSGRDLGAYEDFDNSVVAVQYQAGSMGLNLQKANVAVYFSPPLESIKYEQSKKRIHRIGQNSRCIYYRLITAGSIEERIYAVLAERKDYTDALFKAENKGERENGKRKDT
jgi:SNF2 family DNA or RNA helicase